jgi:hypothetical protein
MPAKIETVGQLRAYLTTVLQDIVAGKVDQNDARNATKVAAQINENFYAEVKIQKMRLEAGEHLGKLGSLPIGES